MPQRRPTSETRASTPEPSDMEVAAAILGRLDTAPGHLDSPLTPGRLRDALAAVLGVAPEGLGSLEPVDAVRALERLSDLAQRVQALEARATHDDLTGVLRRGAGMGALSREIERARRTGASLVLAFADVDGLKAVNDRRGHAAGDRLLCAAADALRARLRRYDLAFRYGGDEFVVALFGTDVATARRVVADVNAGMRGLTRGGTLSAGFAELEDDDTAETLVARADADLYAVRRERGHRSPDGRARPPR